jgi:hypothetical protein
MHSKLVKWCLYKLFDSLGPMLAHLANEKKSAKSNLQEPLRYTYHCWILGGSFFLDHSFAITWYFWHWFLDNFCSILLVAFL